jgi:hypothetical protein
MATSFSGGRSHGAHRYMTAHSLGLVHPINGAHRYMTAHSLGLAHLINGAHRYMTAHVSSHVPVCSINWKLNNNLKNLSNFGVY